MIEVCHKSGIRFHAWINPYRISSTISDLEKINAESPAHSLSNCIGDTETGLYFDPSREEVRRLIIDSVRELLNRYSQSEMTGIDKALLTSVALQYLCGNLSDINDALPINP